ncbi:hypothetical protein Tco_1424428, partial [Tanacetum coccineum]
DMKELPPKEPAKPDNLGVKSPFAKPKLPISQSREEEDVKVERRGEKLAPKEKHDIECLTKILGGEDTPGKKKCKGPRNTRYVSKEGFDERKSLPILATSEGNVALN